MVKQQLSKKFAKKYDILLLGYVQKFPSSLSRIKQCDYLIMFTFQLKFWKKSWFITGKSTISKLKLSAFLFPLNHKLIYSRLSKCTFNHKYNEPSFNK